MIQFQMGTGKLNSKDYVIEELFNLLTTPVHSHNFSKI